MIFLDSNVPMYLVGAPHRNRTEAQILLERLIASKERLVTDAQVIQEILHRYSSLKRLSAITPALHILLTIADEVFALEKADALRASEIVQGTLGLSARDAVHIAIMERHGVQRIFSFDEDFDRWPGLTRIGRV